MLPITQKLLTSRRTRPFLRDKNTYYIRKLKGIIAHWTANYGRGADAMANRNYFNTTERYASAHYIVDDHTILQCVPDNEVAYHVGGRRYTPTGETLREDLTPNYFLVGFEMCVNVNGDWKKTYQNSVDLARYLLHKYNFTINELYRHYDITGKDCPKMMIKEGDWQRFKAEVNRGLHFNLETPTKKGEITTSRLNVREGNGSAFKVVGQLKKNEVVDIYETIGNWYRIGLNQWVHNHYVKITFTEKNAVIEVDDPDGLNIRSGPGVQYPVMETLQNGTTVTLMDQDGNWYQIGASRWVYSRYVRIIELKTGRIKAPEFLTVRKGPGTSFERTGKVQGGTLVKIHEEKNGWYRIGADMWVFGVFVEIIQ